MVGSFGVATTSTKSKIAKLWARLAELQDDVERINEQLETADTAAQLRVLYGAKHRALRDAAEQLGELAPRQINVGTTVRYEIAGVDLDKLA